MNSNTELHEVAAQRAQSIKQLEKNPQAVLLSRQILNLPIHELNSIALALIEKITGSVKLSLQSRVLEKLLSIRFFSILQNGKITYTDDKFLQQDFESETSFSKPLNGLVPNGYLSPNPNAELSFSEKMQRAGFKPQFHSGFTRWTKGFA